MATSIKSAQLGKKILLKHFAIMLVLCIVLQVIIAARGSRIDVADQLLLAGIALYYAYSLYVTKDQLRLLRFGRLIAHVIGFLTVNLSYHIHAFVLFITDNPAIKGAEGLNIDQSWFGVLFGMTTFWGLGLLIHLVASISNRGFEELPKD